jgi:hypothetical protein
MQTKSSFAWEMLEYFCFDPYSSKKDFSKTPWGIVSHRLLTFPRNKRANLLALQTPIVGTIGEQVSCRDKAGGKEFDLAVEYS